MILTIVYIIGFIVTSFGFGWGADIRTASDGLINIALTIIWPITWAFVLFAGIGAWCENFVKHG